MNYPPTSRKHTRRCWAAAPTAKTLAQTLALILIIIVYGPLASLLSAACCRHVDCRRVDDRRACCLLPAAGEEGIA